ncbi:unnamed protein product [Phytophthora fragariaefolia]|uniref:Unnamed protein product n=1 Tax=Phytophthora fragariaefolia TaxID=1490495 RepID=A0A9W6X8E4_9STRA|nr:unnamed protein product [Phytophthora fragariaefolia]
MEFLHASILIDTSGKSLAATMDQFGCFLATHEGKKCNLAPDGVVYLRLLTAVEQGLTLVPDKNNFLTCPLLTLAVALATQDAPCASLLSQLPKQQPQSDAPVDSGVPLHDLPAADPGSLEVTVVPAPTPPFAFVPTNVAALPAQPASTKQKKARTAATKRGEDSMQGHVNRMLKRVTLPAGVTSELTSHIFRRGGAQHASGDDWLAAQWIFDRGAWDKTKTTKAFAYYPQLKTLAPDAPIVTRVEEAMVAAGVSSADMLAWSLAMNEAASPPDQDQNQVQPQDTTHTCLGFSHILAVIDELITSNGLLTARLMIFEAALLKSMKKQVTTGEE